MLFFYETSTETPNFNNLKSSGKAVTYNEILRTVTIRAMQCCYLVARCNIFFQRLTIL
jgi:hypothetical protein